MPKQLLVKGPGTKKETKKQTQHPSYFSCLNKGTNNVRENTKVHEKNKNYKMIPTPCPPTHTLI